jgi:type III secretion system low calcium response chaperone LcrH/SycD
MNNNVKDYTIDLGRAAFLTFYEADEKGLLYPQRVLNVSDSLLDEYYNIAKEIINEGSFKEAELAFTFLTFLNPYYQNFWLGLGIACQSQGNFENAIEAYSAAELLNPLNPNVHLNAYQCHIALENNEAAEIAFNKAISICNINKEYEDVRKMLIQYKEKYEVKK